MNRMWIRLSLSYSLVLLLVLAAPITLFWFAFLRLGPAPEMYSGRAPEAPMAAGMFGMLIMATLFSAFVGVIAGIWVSRGLSKQVTELVVAAQAITPSDLTPRVAVKGVKEIQDLALAFNRMVAELDQSQQARRNMLADVSHELLTPLTVLEGNLRAILDGVYALNEQEISTLYDQTHHLIALVMELRQLAEVEARQLSLHPEETALNELVEETLALFEPLAKEREVELQQLLTTGLPPVMVDRQRIRQVLSNLLSNGLRHSPRGGVVKVQTAGHDGLVQVSVEDTGAGLSLEELDRVFDRFYRTDGVRRWDESGAGLGLAIVKALVEAHGGTITAESSPGNSTKFTILLPA